MGKLFIFSYWRSITARYPRSIITKIYSASLSTRQTRGFGPKWLRLRRRARAPRHSRVEGDVWTTAHGGGGGIPRSWPGVENDACCSRTYCAPRSPSRMTISRGTWTPACSQLCASIVRIQVLYGDNMSKPNIRKITADPTKCNTDSSRRPSVFERLGTKPAIAAAAATAQNTSDYCRNWALNGSCSYGKSCKWAWLYFVVALCRGT